MSKRKQTIVALAAGLGLVLLTGAVCWLGFQRDRGPSPKILGSLSPQARRAWRVVQRRHPHAHWPSWCWKPGWGPPQSCMRVFPEPPLFVFIRTCPENGALGLDWAQVTLDGGRVLNYQQNVGPSKYPAEVLRPPRLTPEEAWSRAAAELAACGCEGFQDRSLDAEPSLELVREDSRIRLAYKFLLPESVWSVKVDAFTGEVGDMDLTYFGAGPLSDTAFPRHSPEPGHDIQKLRDGWVKTDNLSSASQSSPNNSPSPSIGSPSATPAPDPRSPRDGGYSLCFSPDGQIMATGSLVGVKCGRSPPANWCAPWPDIGSPF